MSERVPFRPERTCECPLIRQGYAGSIVHRHPCKRQGVELLAQSGDSITPGKRYRWIQGDDQWARDRGCPEINVVAEVTHIKAGMVFACWDPCTSETCIPSCAVVELVEPNRCNVP